MQRCRYRSNNTLGTVIKTTTTRHSLVLATLLLFLQGIATGCAHAAQDTRTAKEGLIDLRSWNADEPLLLNGEFEFYWQQQLRNEDFLYNRSGEDIPEPAFIGVPGAWNGTIINGEELDGYGFATYRINLLLPSIRPYALKLPDIGTAYELYIDGKSAVEIGTAGTSPETTRPRYYPTVVEFTPERNRVELIFHVSNFHYRLAGIWLPIRLGSTTAIDKVVEYQRSLNMLLFGAIIIIGFYNLALFLLRREDHAPLYLGLFCILLAARLLAVDERYLTRIVELPFDWYVRVEYLSWILALSAFGGFLSTTLPREFPRQFAWAMHGIVLAGCLFVLLTSVETFTYIVPPFQLFTIICMIVASAAFILALLRRREGALILTAAFAVLFYTVVNDILVNMDLIQTPLMLDGGLVVFIFLQSLLISYRFTRSFKLIEYQSSALKAANVQLQTQEKLRRQAEDEWERMSGQIALSNKMSTIETLVAGTEKTMAGMMASLEGPASNKLANVVGDFIIISGRHNHHAQSADLNAIVEQYLASGRYQDAVTHHGRASVTTDLDTSMETFMGSPGHLERLVAGLVEYYLAKDLSEVRLVIATHMAATSGQSLFYGEIPAGDYAVLSIGEHSGNFKVPDDLEHLFTPERTLDYFDEDNPSLGMSVVWSVAREHRATIDILFQDSGGTRIEVYFPANSLSRDR